MTSSPTLSDQNRSIDGSDGKRRKKEVNLVSTSKIPKDDVRRCIPSVFKEAFNSCEKDKFHNILKKYCVEGCSAMYKYVGTNNPFSSSDHTEVLGLDAVSAFWESIFNAVPDSLFDIVETKFRLLPNKKSSIVCKFLYSGTKVFRLCTDEKNCIIYTSNVGEVLQQCPAVTTADTDAVVAATSSICSSDGPPQVLMAEVQRANPTRIDPETQKLFNLGTYLAQPQKVAIIGTLTFYTDANNKICRFEFIFSVKA